MPDGTVRDPVVERSSGDGELDAAATACVLGWRYNPATQDGKPVEAPWKVNVMWILPKVEAFPFAEHPRDCATYYSPTREQLASSFGVTTVTYQITGGVVSNVAVIMSSKNAELDQDAVDCVKSWRYLPTDADGSSTDSRPLKDIRWDHRSY